MLELTKLDVAEGVCAVLKGAADLEILHRALKDLAAHCALEEHAHIMFDLRNVEIRCTLFDLSSLGDELARLGFQPSWRMAILGSSSNVGLTCFETIGQSHGLKVRCFRDRDAACNWLAAVR